MPFCLELNYYSCLERGFYIQKWCAARNPNGMFAGHLQYGQRGRSNQMMFLNLWNSMIPGFPFHLYCLEVSCALYTKWTSLSLQEKANYSMLEPLAHLISTLSKAYSLSFFYLGYIVRINLLYGRFWNILNVKVLANYWWLLFHLKFFPPRELRIFFHKMVSILKCQNISDSVFFSAHTHNF